MPLKEIKSNEEWEIMGGGLYMLCPNAHDEFHDEYALRMPPVTGLYAYATTRPANTQSYCSYLVLFFRELDIKEGQNGLIPASPLSSGLWDLPSCVQHPA